MDDVHARLTEAQVEDAFCAHLNAEGWRTSTTNKDFTDVIATRGDNEVLIAEVKGHTVSPGVVVDIGFGQLLRRMKPTDKPTRYAIVVPHTLRWHVGRVHEATRERLGVEVYIVHADLSVERL